MAEAHAAGSALGELSGQVIGGRYRLGELLGQGGMGVVYTALQESLARPIAIKVLQPVLAQNAESLARFRAEAERAGRLAHPHIVQILDFGQEAGGAAWIAMELLRGESLGARMARAGMSEAELVRIARETLSALEAAHGAHLVHRDLKPDNIFLADVPGIGTSVKVLDFGIAKLLDDDASGKLTATGILIGTPLYMAPEQARGEDIDARADLYSLGAVLYEVLSGRPPFVARNYHALLYAMMNESPQPIATYRPDVSPALAAVVARAMAKQPSERWQSAREMAEALRAVSASTHTPVLPVVSRTIRDEALGTAETVATPSPGASTPALGGTNAGVSVPPTRVSSAEEFAATSLALPMSTPPSTHATPTRTRAPEPAFRWRLMAIAGGVLATAAVVIGAGKLLTQGDASPAAVATLAPMAPSTSALAPSPAALNAPSVAPQSAAPQSASPQSTAPEGAVAPGAAPQDVALGAGPGYALRRTEPASAGSQNDALGIAQEPLGQRAAPPLGTPQSAAPGVIGGLAPPAPPPALLSRRPAPAVGGGAGRAPAASAGPRPSVTYAGGTLGGMSDTSTVSSAIRTEGWADCWPRDERAPDVNRGRDFLVDVAPDGQVTSAAAAPNNEDPAAFAACVSARLRRLNLGPTAGGVAHVRISFHVEVR